MQVRLACWLLNSSSTNGSLVYVVNDVRELPVSQSELSHGELHRGITRVWYLLNVLWYRSFFQVWVRSGEREWRWSWREWRLSWQASIYVFSGNGHTPRFWPRDLPMSGLQRDEASREKLAVYNCFDQVKMHSCLSLQEASRRCSERFLEDTLLPGTNAETVQHAWNLVHDMLCIDVHQTQLRTPNAVVAYLEELLDGVGSKRMSFFPLPANWRSRWL